MRSRLAASVFLLGLVVVTSTLGYLAGRRRLQLGAAGLRRAAGRVLECLGLAVLFFAANMALGLAIVLAARAVAGISAVSIYVLDDVVLVVLSLLQGLVFGWWRAGRSG